MNVCFLSCLLKKVFYLLKYARMYVCMHVFYVAAYYLTGYYHKCMYVNT